MNRLLYHYFIFSPIQIAYLVIRAASAADLLFIFTTCLNCIWSSPRWPVTKLTPLPTATLMSTPNCHCPSCDTKKAYCNALLCQAQQNYPLK